MARMRQSRPDSGLESRPESGAQQWAAAPSSTPGDPPARTKSHFQALYLYWSSPESGDLWYKSRQWKKRFRSRSEGGNGVGARDCGPPHFRRHQQIRLPASGDTFNLRILVYLVIYDAGWVSLEHLRACASTPADPPNRDSGPI